VALERIREASRLAVGRNQTTKAIEQNSAIEVFLAQDADQRLISRIATLAQHHNIPIVWVETMKQLGVACGIEVGAATAAIVEL
jgi:large subunit ribosomal protein L7A